jgi:hypothetical protein
MQDYILPPLPPFERSLRNIVDTGICEQGRINAVNKVRVRAFEYHVNGGVGGEGGAGVRAIEGWLATDHRISPNRE